MLLWIMPVVSVIKNVAIFSFCNIIKQKTN
nr:MAG TPA: hypothetical protein [Bacteriophage sp.]